MSATGAPSKALKVRPPAAKHYQLRHLCPLPNSLLGHRGKAGWLACLNSVLNVKALVSAFNQEKALVGAFTD